MLLAQPVLLRPTYYAQAVQDRTLELALSGPRKGDFVKLRDSVCGGDPVLAVHVWRSIVTAALACGLHLDHLDAGHLFNLVVSLGLTPHGDVVPLKGCLLVMVAAVYASSLAAAQIASECPQAHDDFGNIVLLDPPSINLGVQLRGPSTVDIERLDAPKRQSAVVAAVKEGRAILIFFRSGGAVASQLGHHWHAVVRTHRNDPEAMLH
jgi:hypothetical protein